MIAEIIRACDSCLKEIENSKDYEIIKLNGDLYGNVEEYEVCKECIELPYNKLNANLKKHDQKRKDSPHLRGY